MIGIMYSQCNLNLDIMTFKCWFVCTAIDSTLKHDTYLRPILLKAL